MFGFFPMDFVTVPVKKRSIEDIKIGSMWRDINDNSIWKVTHKDSRVHIFCTSRSAVKEYDVRLFFGTFSAVEYGATCIYCKRDFEYAEKDPRFICWGCKNGA